MSDWGVETAGSLPMAWVTDGRSRSTAVERYVEALPEFGCFAGAQLRDLLGLLLGG